MSGGCTDVVTKVDRRDGVVHVTVTRTYPAAAPYVATFAVSPDGVFRVVVGGKKLDKPATVLKLPPQAGTEWEDGGQTFRVAREEEVRVPAGTFRAVRIDATNPGATGVTHFWYAPGVGLVKAASPDSDGQTVLKSFAPGK